MINLLQNFTKKNNEILELYHRYKLSLSIYNRLDTRTKVEHDTYSRSNSIYEN